MKNRVILLLSLTVAGVMTYLMFSGGDEGFYHFPWELFAGIGMVSWIVKEVLKIVKDTEKELGK